MAYLFPSALVPSLARKERGWPTPVRPEPVEGLHFLRGRKCRASTGSARTDVGTLSATYGSNHPASGIGVDRLERQIGAHRRPERADAILDMRRARAVGGFRRVD